VAAHKVAKAPPTIAKARPPEQGKEKVEVLVAAREVGRALLTAVEAGVPLSGRWEEEGSSYGPQEVGGASPPVVRAGHPLDEMRRKYRPLLPPTRWLKCPQQQQRPPERGKEKMAVLQAAQVVGRVLPMAVEARATPGRDTKKMAAPRATQEAAKALHAAKTATGLPAEEIYEGGKPSMAILMLLLLLGTITDSIELCDKMAALVAAQEVRKAPPMAVAAALLDPGEYDESHEAGSG
jgi:hypothetical protein